MSRPEGFDDGESPSGESGAHDIDHAGRLRATLTTPIWNPLVRRTVGNGELDYEVYLRTVELLSLQTPWEDRVTEDELMFQIVHQTQELWLKLLGNEAVALVRQIDAGDLPTAAGQLDRMRRVVESLEADIRVLDTLAPSTFLVIRRHLGDGSGQQSPGFNGWMAAARAIRGSLERLLRRHQVELEEIYEDPTARPALMRLCEQLVDLDEGYQRWLVAHYFLVRRTMGVDREVAALDGLPSRMLVGRMTKPLFPALWSVRVTMTKQWTRAGGTAPGEPRVP